MDIILGIPAGGIPRPWKHFDIKSIMINAYELIRTPRLLNKIKDIGLRNFLDFNGIIYVDSGGYQFLKNNINISIKDIAKIYNYLDADYFITLDQPPNHNVSISSENTDNFINGFLKKNIENFKKLHSYYKIKNLIPVIHPPRLFAKREYEEYSKIINTNIIAFGGLVPYFLTKKGLNGGRKEGLKLLYWFRNIHKRKIHVMGLGAPSLIPLLKKIGINSTDSSTWRLKAAFGKIILPNTGERHITDRKIKFGGKKISSEEIELINKVLDKMNLDLNFEDLKRSFRLRALFNAYVILHYDTAYNLEKNPYKSLFTYLSELKKSVNNFTIN